MQIFYLSLLLLTIALNITSAYSAEYVKKSIGPVAVCRGRAESITQYIDSCHSRCMLDPEPKGTMRVILHQSRAEGPSVVECSKMTRTQVFTQTWTFSTIAGDVHVEVNDVSDEECRNAIRDNCPDYVCNHREKDSLEPEYHYGSDTTVTETSVNLVGIPSIIVYSGRNLMINPVSSSDSFPYEDNKGSSNRKRYYWKKWSGPDMCPFSEVQRYGCDKYNDDGDYYVCDGGRFILTPNGTNLIAEGICPSMRASNEGFIYQTQSGDPTYPDSGRLGISEEQKMEIDGTFLRHKIHQIATHLDAEICANQCELLTLESRTMQRPKTLMRVGNEYMLAYQNGTGIPCILLHGCRLPEKKLFCGNPPRVGVVCTSYSGLWDPTEAYLGEDEACYKPDEVEELSVSIGSEHYVVDKDLTVLAPPNISHGVYPTGYQSLQMTGVRMDVKSLQKLREPWVASRLSSAGISKTVNSTSKINSPQLNIGSAIMDGWRGIGSAFESAEHIVGILVIVTVAAGSLWLTVKLVKGIREFRNSNEGGSASRTMNNDRIGSGTSVGYSPVGTGTSSRKAETVKWI